MRAEPLPEALQQEFEAAALKGQLDIDSGKGFESVLVDEFTIPSGYTHHHSLMLLHECRAAIFDVSSEAGQIMEIERLRDYLISDILIVYQTPRAESPKVTEMLTTLLERTGCKPQVYRTIDEGLPPLIRSFLQALPDIN